MKSSKFPAVLVTFAILFSAQAQEPEPPGSPSGVLEKEHRITLKILTEAEKTSAALHNEDMRVPEKRLSKMIDFFANFVDRCHHAKEERLFFAAMAKQPSVDASLIRELKDEHVKGRIYITAMRSTLPAAAGGDATARGILRMSLKEYAGLIRAHIAKENNMLFVGSSKKLDSEKQEELLKGFSYIEHEELGKGFHEKYHGIAMELIGKK